MVKRIVLVEDDVDDRELFFSFLSKRKDIVLLPPSGNGLELIDFLKSIESDDGLPDLIVLDQNMPKMNGKQTLSFLKSEERYARIPTVIYSTYTDTTLIADCMKLGAEMVAIKPIDSNGYHKMMDDFLQVFDELGK
ncbi:MAG: response regulator [Chryseolinea sp.]